MTNNASPMSDTGWVVIGLIWLFAAMTYINYVWEQLKDDDR